MEQGGPCILPPHTIPLGRPSGPAPSIQYRASNLDWCNPVDEGTTEGLLKLPCIVQKNPQVLHTARQVECHPVNTHQRAGGVGHMQTCQTPAAMVNRPLFSWEEAGWLVGEGERVLIP